MGSEKSTADEWLELGGFAVDPSSSIAYPAKIGGWKVISVKSGVESIIATLPSGLTIGSGQYLVISNYSEADSRIAITPAFTSTAMSLPNTKLLLRLRNASGTLMDEVDDGLGDPFAGANPSANGPKASMERIDLRIAGNTQTKEPLKNIFSA